ncbi:MAG: CPBP family intramembrane metalloprotease [bacterium]|nr:CPBP family intramembrane metalloprotease [bacterium]
MELIDHIFVVIFTVAYPVYGTLTYPKLKEAVAANKPGARSREFIETAFWLWGFSITAYIIWTSWERPFPELGLGTEMKWQFWAGVLLVVVVFIIAVAQCRAAAKGDEKITQTFKEKVKGVAELLPQTTKELKLFILLSITAGICEELLFRGYLIWYIKGMTGLTGAVIISAIIFGLAHSYQGLSGIIKTGILGLIFALVFVFTGSLWVPMVLHALVDIQSGLIGFYILGRNKETT